MARTGGARPGRKRPGRYHHGDLRRALVDETLKTIQRRGIGAVTLRGVGQALGVSRTALYRHFADKSALLDAVACEGFRKLRLALVEAWEGAGRGRRGFEAMGAAYIRFAVENPSHYRVIFGALIGGSGGSPELAQEGGSAFQALVDALVEQQQTGMIRRDDPVQLALLVWATVHGIAMLAIDGRLRHQRIDVGTLTQYAMARIRTGIRSQRSESGAGFASRRHAKLR